jgi:hypothetical protein
MAKSIHSDVASFVANALTPAEDAAFTEHLADCETCRDEIVWMSELSVAVGSLDPEASVTPIRRPRYALLVAAAAALLALGGAIGFTIGHSTTQVVAVQQDPTQALFDKGVLHSARDVATQVSAQVAVVASQGGVEVGLRLVDPAGPKNCELVAIGQNGVEQTAMTWHVPDGGFSGAPLVTRGQAGLRPDQIARWEIRSEGRTVLAIN